MTTVCRAALIEGAVDSGTDQTVNAATLGPGEEKTAPLVGHLERGDSFDHFVVVDKLGEGGMGLVLAAYDPDLDRKVAIKLLHSQEGEAGQEATSRLFREAQAMARLTHPNVVTVYEVGIVDEQVFIAMEFVAGRTLGDWLASQKRSAAEIIAVFGAAGRGLAAAHDAGMVHRDFKPGNVIVGDDGGVRVLDFGLARPVLGAAPAQPAAASVSASALDAPLTQAGAVVGTPAYMAPEQFLGQAVDERSDQFSFCVALFEALCGERPFAAMTLADLTPEAVDARVRDRAGRAEVPAWLRRILCRGLQPARSGRYPTMAALLADLEVDRSARRRRWITAVVSIGLVAAVAAVGFGARTSSRCANIGDHLIGVWDPDRRAALHDGFVATGRPYAGDTYTAVARQLDDYVGRWVAMRVEACEATHEHGEQSQTLLDRRMQCLDRRLAVLRGVIETLADQPDGELVDRSLEIVAGLSDLARCADVAALTAVVPPPEGGPVGREVTRLRELLDRAIAAKSAGRYRVALDGVAALVEPARSVDYAPLLAEVLFELGQLRDLVDDRQAALAPLREAAGRAATGRDDELTARVWVELVDVLSADSQFAEALALVPVAEGWLARAGGGNPELEVHLLSARAVALSRSGAYDQARASYERALALAERELGTQHPARTKVLNNLALLLSRQGEYAHALDYYQRALAVQEQRLPADHPSIANTLNNIGMVVLDQGEPDRAKAYFARSLAIRQRALGEQHRLVADSYSNLGNVALRKNQLGEAEGLYLRALAIADAMAGDGDPRIANYLDNLASVYWLQGNFATTGEYQQRALAIREKLLGPDHPDVARSLQNLGGALAESGHCEAALPYFERTLAIRTRSLRADHPDVGWTLSDLGACRVDLGDAAAALPLLERALEIRTAASVDPILVADTRFQLARALYAKGQRKRAITLAEQARDTYRKSSAADPYARLVEAWLAKPR